MSDPRPWNPAAALGAAFAVATALVGGACGASQVTDTPKAAASQPPASPLVALRIVLSVGAVEDPPGKEGLASLTAHMVARGGTAKRSYAQVLNAMYPLAANIDVYVTKEQTVFAGTIHRDNLQAYTELLSEHLLSPRMSDKDFERLKKSAVDHVTKTLRSNDDEELGKHGLHDLMYRGHPYQHPNAGTVSGLANIALADVKAFYAKYYAADRLHIGVGGGAPEGFQNRLTKGLTDKLAATSPVRAALPKAPTAAGPTVMIVEKATRSVAVSMGHPLPITRRDDDFYPLFVAASYLGEHRTFNGVLMRNMRGKRGLNYGDYAYIEMFIQDGWSTFPLPNIQRRQQHFEIWIRPVVPANAPFAIKQAIYETAKLVREGIPQQGFEDTKSYLASFCRLWTQSAGRRLGYVMDGKLVGREIAAELVRRLPTMTRDQVNRAIRKYLRPDQLRIVAVARDAAALRDALVSGKATPIVYDTKGTPADILAEDKRIEVFKLGLDAANVSTVPAEKLFQ